MPATSGAVASSSLADLARLIRRAKEKVPDLLSGSSDGEAAAPDGGAEVQQLEWYNGLAVVSWLNLGFEAADLGGGGAARVMWHVERTLLPGCMVCPPCLAAWPGHVLFGPLSRLPSPDSTFCNSMVICLMSCTLYLNV